MLELVFWAALVALSVGGAVAGAAGRARRRRAWRAHADRLGLAHVFHPEALTAGCVLQGTSDGFVVRLVERDGSKHSSATTTLTVDGRGALAHVAELRAEADVTDAEREALKELQVGDSSFDDNVFVRGSRPALIALLGPELRQRIASFLVTGGRIVDGVVRCEREGFLVPSASDDVAWLETRLGRALAVASGLRRPSDLVALLCQRFSDEPVRRVRLVLLDLLANLLAEDDRPRQVLREALLVGDVELRLHAAAALGEEGRATLLGIARDTDADERCAAQAIEALRRRLPLEQAIAILDAAVPRQRQRVAQAAITALGRIGGTVAVTRLVAVLAGPSALLRIAAADALALTGDPAAERPLLDALARAAPAARIPLVEALSAVGTSQAVPDLHALLRASDAGSELARATRQAIAMIQARLSGASPGQISLAEGQAGQLSLASDTRAGQISLPEEGRGAP